MADKIRLREPTKDSYQEAYEAWKNDSLGPFSRFEPVGLGPLLIDKKTRMVYDGVEFLMKYEEERKGANICAASQAEAELDLQYMEFCEKAPLVEIPRWFFRTSDIEIEDFGKIVRTSKDSLFVKEGAYIWLNGKIIAVVVGDAYISIGHSGDN